MPSLMPSLLKYFITVGALLFVGLVGLNAVLEPGGPGPRVIQDSPKAKLVRHDPRASLVERLREEEAAQSASGKAEVNFTQPATAGRATPAPSTATQVTPTPRPMVTQAAAIAQPQAAPAAQATPAAQAQPAKPVVDVPVAPTQVQAPAPTPPPAVEHRTAPAALTGVATAEEEHATRVAHEKAAAEKARKKRVARERSRSRPMDDAYASRQQDQYYYTQRVPAPTYAYAPPQRPAYGPFNQNQGWFGGGWGRGW